MSDTMLAQEVEGFEEELAQEGLRAPVGAIRPTKLRYTHEAVIDQIVANPWVSQNQLAAMFGYTPGWLSTVMGSDAFKAKLAERRGEMVDPALQMTLNERFNGLVEKSLAVLQEKLSQPALSIPNNLALRAAELGAKALGLGQPNHSTVVVAMPTDHLEGLAGRLLSLQARAQAAAQGPQTIEGERAERVVGTFEGAEPFAARVVGTTEGIEGECRHD